MACSSSSRIDHARPLAEDEPVAVAVERPAGPGRLVVAGREGGQEVEAGHAERVDHAVGPAREHHVGVAPADDLGRLADRLRAGGAGGQAVGVRPPGAEDPGQVAGGRARLLLGLVDRVQLLEALAGEAGGVDLPVARRGVDELDEPGEVLLPLARAEVDAEPRAVEVRRRLQPRVVDRHPGGGDGELGVPAVLAPAVGVGDVVGQVEALGLGGDPGREAGGVEQRDRADAAPPFLERGPGRLQVAADRGDHPHPRHDDSALHGTDPLGSPMSDAIRSTVDDRRIDDPSIRRIEVDRSSPARVARGRPRPRPGRGGSGWC